MAEGIDDLNEDLLRPIQHLPRHPLAMLRFGTRALQPATWIARRWERDETRAMFAGAAAHSFQPLSRPTTGAIGLMLIAAGHAVGWPVAIGGSGTISAALVAALREHGATIETGVRVASLDELGPLDGGRIVMLDLAPGAVVQIAGDRLPWRVRRAYRRWRRGPAAYKLDLVVEGGIPWRNEDCRRATTVHVGGTLESIAAAEAAVCAGRMPDRPFLLVGQQYLADPQRSNGQVHPVWTYAHVPHGYDGDASEAILRQLERFAPGVRDRVVAMHASGPAAIERENANFAGRRHRHWCERPVADRGASAGGDRSVLDRHPWRLPVLGGHTSGRRCPRHVRRQRRSVGAPLAPLTVVPAALHGVGLGSAGVVITLLLLHLVVGVGIIAAGSRLGRRGALIGLLPPLATVIWLVTKLGPVEDGDAVTEYVNWIPDLGVAFDLRLDAFGALMVLLISGVGVLVFGFAAAYLPSEGEGVGRLTGLLVLFSGAMVGLVLADNLLVLYLFWELTSVTSFLLIGNDHRRAEARAAALQALLVTGTGALAMLAGFLLLGQAAGTYQLSAIVADPPTGSMVGVALALILLGAFTKSAQYPFHSWLPAAMVAPTPVSAYLHAAAMVKAGIYLIARLSPAFAVDIDWWRPVVIGVGLLTMVAGGLRALRQHDLKLLLAFGTVSQLGLMVAVFGIGTAEAMAAGAVLLLAHGAFKAANFMAVGIVEHQFGTRDLRRLPRLDRSWGQVWLIVVISAGSMAALPVGVRLRRQGGGPRSLRRRRERCLDGGVRHRRRRLGAHRRL